MATLKEDIQIHFHPDHWADLQKSGLNPKSIYDSNICSCPPDLISKILGFNPPGVESALVFPYPGIEFQRLKVFPPQKDKKGHSVKYLQRKRSGSHLYFPPNFWDRLKDASNRIYITEGEKKTLRADQDGVCALGIGGINAWKTSGNLLPEFSQIPFSGREVRIIPDSDFHTNSNVRSGTLGLSSELDKLGARIKIVDLRWAA